MFSRRHMFGPLLGTIFGTLFGRGARAESYTDRRPGTAHQLAIKTPCRVATTANIRLSGVQRIDGVRLAPGDRVLVKDQAKAAQNGIYLVNEGKWPRSLDFDGAFDIVQGTQIRVNAGRLSGHHVFVLGTPDPIRIGRTALKFLGVLTNLSVTATGSTVSRSLASDPWGCCHRRDLCP